MAQQHKLQSEIGSFQLAVIPGYKNPNLRLVYEHIHYSFMKYVYQNFNKRCLICGPGWVYAGEGTPPYNSTSS